MCVERRTDVEFVCRTRSDAFTSSYLALSRSAASMAECEIFTGLVIRDLTLCLMADGFTVLLSYFRGIPCIDVENKTMHEEKLFS